jgi:transposase-like protein
MYTVKRTRNTASQAGTSALSLKTKSTQCTQPPLYKSSYNRNENKQATLTYDELKQNYLADKETTIEWLNEIGLITKETICRSCGNVMKWTKCADRSDGYKFECRGTKSIKRHRIEKSIRENTWFDKTNLTLEEVVQFTYWWSNGLSQDQIITQLRLSTNTIVDWFMFCREVCDVIIGKESQQIGGKGKRVQIDESKVGKRKYHKGHYVEGQWIFGGIEEDSRKCFLVTVEDRSEKTLLTLIKKWIAPESVIISDCWKGYINLEKHGYIHKTVNHSQEFKNEDGDHTNKIEGHWKQMKAAFPTHGRRKYHYSYYLAEFIWRYIHKDEDLFWVFLEDIKKIYNPNMK